MRNERSEALGYEEAVKVVTRRWQQGGEGGQIIRDVLDIIGFRSWEEERRQLQEQLEGATERAVKWNDIANTRDDERQQLKERAERAIELLKLIRHDFDAQIPDWWPESMQLADEFLSEIGANR